MRVFLFLLLFYFLFPSFKLVFVCLFCRLWFLLFSIVQHFGQMLFFKICFINKFELDSHLWTNHEVFFAWEGTETVKAAQRINEHQVINKYRFYSLLVLCITMIYGNLPCLLSVENHRMLLPVRNIPRKPNKTGRRGGNLLGNTIFLLRTAVCLWQMINAPVSLTVHNISSTCHRVLRSGPWLCPHRGKKSDLRSPQSQWNTNVHGSRTKQLGSASCPGLCKSGNRAFNLLTCKIAKWYSHINQTCGLCGF